MGPARRYYQDGWGGWNATCAGAEEFASHPAIQRALAAQKVPNTTDAAACALSAAFCARFTEAVPLARAAFKLPRAAKLFGHGMSNVLAETGSRHGFDHDNLWQLRVAAALNRTARLTHAAPPGFRCCRARAWVCAVG